MGLCPYGPMEDRWDVLRTLSLLSHGGQVRCPKDCPMEDRWDVLIYCSEIETRLYSARTLQRELEQSARDKGCT